MQVTFACKFLRRAHYNNGNAIMIRECGKYGNSVRLRRRRRHRRRLCENVLSQKLPPITVI